MTTQYILEDVEFGYAHLVDTDDPAELLKRLGYKVREREEFEDKLGGPIPDAIYPPLPKCPSK